MFSEEDKILSLEIIKKMLKAIRQFSHGSTEMFLICVQLDIRALVLQTLLEYLKYYIDNV